MVFLGIELQHAWRLYTLVALDSNLRLVRQQQGRLPDILAYVASLDSTRIAICAPARLNQGRLQREEFRSQLFKPLPGNHTFELRQVEYELLSQGLPSFRTPAELSACPAWMRRGFRLYAELQTVGFSALDETDSPRAFLETCPEAIFTCLLGQEPFPSDTLQGRIQRQLVLWDHRLPLRDPMVFFEEVTRHKLLRGILPDQDIHSIAHLNAFAAAFVANQTETHPAQVKRFGETEEGIVFLPVPLTQNRE